MPRTPSVGSMPSFAFLRNWVGHPRTFTCRFACLMSRTLVAHRVRSEPRIIEAWLRAELSRAVQAAPRGNLLDAPGQDASNRLLQPTSRHEHPQIVRPPCVGLSPRRTPSAPSLRPQPQGPSQSGARLPCGKLATNGCAIDVAHRASGSSDHSPPSFLEKSRAPLRAMLPLSRLFRPWTGLTASTSDAPCRAPRPSGNPNAFEEPEPAFTDHASTRSAFPAQSAFHRQVLSRARFRECDFLRARHQSRDFAAYGLASDVVSLP